MTKFENYVANILPNYSADDLMDSLVSASEANWYGSHDDQVQAIRAELRTRTS